jgi:hypothetical protein
MKGSAAWSYLFMIINLSFELVNRRVCNSSRGLAFVMCLSLMLVVLLKNNLYRSRGPGCCNVVRRDPVM